MRHAAQEQYTFSHSHILIFSCINRTLVEEEEGRPGLV